MDSPTKKIDPDGYNELEFDNAQLLLLALAYRWLRAALMSDFEDGMGETAGAQLASLQDWFDPPLTTTELLQSLDGIELTIGGHLKMAGE